jgi:hypothetical protein
LKGKIDIKNKKKDKRATIKRINIIFNIKTKQESNGNG